MTIASWLNDATSKLTAANIPSARLDAELIVAHVLGVNRAWLIAHGDENVACSMQHVAWEKSPHSSTLAITSPMFSDDPMAQPSSDSRQLLERRGLSERTASSAADQEMTAVDTRRKPSGSEENIGEVMDAVDSALAIADELLRKRINRVPLAYLIGHKEFYGHEFIVTPDVLIPRPESETIIDVAKEIIHSSFPDKETVRIADIGTGSGCLAITLSLEIPRSAVTAIDISNEALVVARQNAHALSADINFVISDLLQAFSQPTASHLPSTIFDLIVANLPYVDPTWQRSPETDHEPSLALFADDAGLSLIKKCIQQSQGWLHENSVLILEADPCQHAAISQFAEQCGYHTSRTEDYCIVLAKA